MAPASITLADIAIIIGILAGLVTIIGGVVAFVKWYGKRHYGSTADKRDLFTKSYKDLSVLWERLNHVRENGPRDVTMGCFKLGSDRWDEDSNWDGLSEERRGIYSKKLRSRLFAVDAAYSNFRSALQNLNEACYTRLLDQIREYTQVDFDHPPIMFGELVGAWVDNIIRKGYQKDEIIGWPIAEALITATDVAATIRGGPSLNISKMTLAKCCSQMIIEVEEQESKLREEFEHAENELREAVKEARRSFPSQYITDYKPTLSPFSTEP